MKEIYKDIPNYEGLYQVSNLGNVKRLERKTKHWRGGISILPEKILTKTKHSKGYLVVSLYVNKTKKQKYIHQLVAMAFLNHKPNGHELVVDHIDNNHLNNTLTNLQITTNRHNTAKNIKSKKTTSIFTGVSFSKKSNKWKSQIYINGKIKYIGLFKDEYDAHLAYEKELKSLT